MVPMSRLMPGKISLIDRCAAIPDAGGRSPKPFRCGCSSRSLAASPCLRNILTSAGCLFQRRLQPVFDGADKIANGAGLERFIIEFNAERIFNRTRDIQHIQAIHADVVARSSVPSVSGASRCSFMRLRMMSVTVSMIGVAIVSALCCPLLVP